MMENAKMQDLTPKIDEDEINLLDYWRVIWKRRKLIAYIVVATVVLTAVYSLTMTNIYQAKAVITPVAGKDGSGASSVSSMMAQQFGIIQAGPAPGTEILNLLKANIVREKMIEKYQLMPVLFPKQWDPVQKQWKQGGGGFSLNPLALIGVVRKLVGPEDVAARKKDTSVPDAWDGIRMLNKIIMVTQNVKENTITISVDFRDPEMAATIAKNLMDTLVDYIAGEAKRVSTINQKYLETQLIENADPFIKQKIYMLIAQQIETVTMAEIKENFAFKIIDPPKAPDRKIKPKRAQMVMLSFVVALFIGIFVAFLLEYLEKQNININIGKLPWRFRKR
jgi:uncharacterized protein involved in exopolysaccharide biosynthesis